MKSGLHILVGTPSGGTISHGTSEASFLATLRHRATVIRSCSSGPNFNRIWCDALNRGMAGEATHLATLHADLSITEDQEGVRWADKLVEELEETGADFVSVPNAIKDDRGLTSAGIGTAERWNPWRRWSTWELGHELPETFGIEDVGYDPETRFLLHNNACCMWDLRKPLWYVPDEQGACRAIFNFTETIRLMDGRWVRDQDSEDWAYSRDLWRMGARTIHTSKIKLWHHDGGISYPNFGSWGSQLHDEATAPQWRPEIKARMLGRLREEVGELIEV